MPEDIGHEEDVPVERKAAEMSLQKAREAAKRRHFNDAVQHARQALSEDPSHAEAHRFLGELYEEGDELARASREYQELIHGNPDDAQAWEALRRVDPASAERLERLHDVAPDPFVATRASVADDMFADMGADDEEEYDPSDQEQEAEPEPVEQEVAVAVPVTVEERVPWAFEQDYEFRERLLSRPGVDLLLEKLQDMADDYDAWETALVGCAHLDKDRHPGEHEMIGELAQLMGVPPPEMFFEPERRMLPTIIGGDPVMMAITSGMMKALPEPSLRFAFGRMIAHLALGDLVCHHVAIVVLQRSPGSQTDVEEALTDLLVRTTLGWDVGISREEMLTTRKIAHAWDLRSELSADRGGLLACGDLEAACLAIARATARDSDKAAAMKLEDFIAEYRDQDPRQLAVIDPKECPLRSGPYSVYRILMLRWWARSEQYQRLVQA